MRLVYYQLFRVDLFAGVLPNLSSCWIAKELVHVSEQCIRRTVSSSGWFGPANQRRVIGPDVPRVARPALRPQAKRQTAVVLIAADLALPPSSSSRASHRPPIRSNR